MLGPFATASRFTLSFTRCRYCHHCRTPPAHRCPRRRRRRRRQRVTEGTAMAPWNGPNHPLKPLDWAEHGFRGTAVSCDMWWLLYRFLYGVVVTCGRRRAAGVSFRCLHDGKRRVRVSRVSFSLAHCNSLLGTCEHTFFTESQSQYEFSYIIRTTPFYFPFITLQPVQFFNRQQGRQL